MNESTNFGLKTTGDNDQWRNTLDYHNENMGVIDSVMAKNQDALGIIVDGNKAAVSATTGQYIILRNSTITGKTDGLYTAAKSIPANTAIDGTYLTAVSGGGLNALNGKITNITYNVINPLNGYFTKRDAFRAKIRCGVAIVESYINFTTEIPAGTEFASIETTGIYGSYIVINTSTRAVYYAALRSTGRFESETAIPTGYYYFVGCAI